MTNQATLPTGGGLMNPMWRYTPSAATDIRVLFERVQMEMRKKETSS